MSITPESLLTLEAYARQRKAYKAQIIAHRKLRSVALGEHMTLQFEDEQTVRYLEVAEALNSTEGMHYLTSLTVNGGTGDVALSGAATLPTPSGSGTVTL